MPRKKSRRPKRNAEFTAGRETITVEIAKRYLKALPEGQRNLRKRVVERYAEAMKAGRWKLTGEAIKFDTHGNLIDGQHRLQAVVLSGTEIICEVQRNVPDDAFMDLDTGLARTPGDLLKIAGYSYTKNVGAIIRFLDSLYKIEDDKIQPSSLAKRKCPPEILLEYADAHDEALIEAARRTTTKEARQVCSPPALFGALYFMFSEHNPKGAQEFFELLIHGMDEDGKGFEHGRQDPVYLLRKFMLELKTSKHKRRPNFYKAALAVKAWNAFQDRQPLTSLRYSENEGWPQINRRKTRLRADLARVRAAKKASRKKATKKATAKKTTKRRSRRSNAA
jgi:hypothetical protein